MNVKLPNTAIIFAVILLLFGLISFQASAAATTVTICHATASATNPYVKTVVAVSSLGNGHGHSGVNAGDIIPPTPGTDFPNGQNWDSTGQAIYNNNCKIPGPTPTPTLFGQPTATPTPTGKPTPTPTSGGPTPTPTGRPTPTPTTGEVPTVTPTPTGVEVTPTGEPGQGNNCTIVTLVNNSSNTGNNTANGNTGGNTSVTTGNATTNTTVNSSCGINIANIQFTGSSHTDINVIGNGDGSTNSVFLTNNTVVQVSQ